MTDAEKLNIIDRIIGAAFEFEAIDPKDKSGYYEGIVCAIYGVLNTEVTPDGN
jgi:hypothetical protein